MNRHHHNSSVSTICLKMHSLERTRFHTENWESGSSEDFFDKAIDALSVIKISNSYLQTTLGASSSDQKVLASFTMIKKSLRKIEACLDSLKHEKKNSSKNRLGHSSQNIKKTWFALSELMQMIKPKNCPSTVKINLPRNDFQVFGNFYKLVVVFSNLVENAIEAMKNDGVINITAREGSEFVVIDVKDSGPGLSQEGIKKIFSTLYTTKSGGNGLGLKVTKTIIEMHGCSILVRNNPTTFSIKIPKK